jgi:tetratricopeptide (TPR) repeat protein
VRAGAPFGLVASALRWRCGVHEPAVTADERARLGANVRAVCETIAPGDDRLLAFASELAGAPIPSAEAPEALRAARQSPRLMADAMRRAFLELVALDLAQRPVAFVLDDVHWGDAPSVDLIDEALRVGAERPVALIAFARPEVTELFPRLWAQRGLTHVRLGPLSRKAAVQLCTEVLGSLVDDQAIERIVARASGNPFYLEELMRATEAGDVERLPETVLAMLQVRLEALSPPARRVLRAASVLGTAVRRGALAAVLGEGARELDGVIGELVTRELLVPLGDDELVFRHEIIRDAAYALLLDHDRQAAHRAAGAWLETQREREALVVAQHFERGGDRPRASLWYRYAGEQALDAGDPRAVIDRATRGLACGATGEERATLLLLQAYAFDWLGDTLGAEGAAIDAMDASAEGSTVWLRAAGEVAVAAARQNNLGLVSSIARHLLRCESSEDRSAYAIALAHTAAELLVAGRHDLASRVIIKMDEAAAGGRDPYTEGWRLRVHAIAAAVRGDAAACLRMSQESAAALERIDARRDLVAGLVNVGFGQIEVGQYALAEATLRRAMAIADELQIVRTIAIATQNLALAVLFQGRADEALALACDAERMANEQMSARVAAGAVIYQARALLALGRAPEALERGRRAEAATTEVPPMRAYALAAIADALLRTGDTAAALARARQGVELMDSLGGVDEGEHYLLAVLARAHEASGDPAAAAAVARRAATKIDRVAAAIDDPALRASFLAAPEIAELRARAR